MPIMIKPITPKPIIIAGNYYSADKMTDSLEAAEALLSGEYVLIDDVYQTGLSILSSLKQIAFNLKKHGDFSDDRKNRNIYHIASNKLLVPIKNSKIALRKAPKIGWLEKLFQTSDEYFLSMPQIQGLNSSWQWYIKGVEFPMLRHKIHPFYGVYFPTRHEHLFLFDAWLKEFNCTGKTAIDMGTGCGVLSFMMQENGFDKIFAADINPNAIISVQQEIEKRNCADKITAVQSDLFENLNESCDLIVFNPPWLPVSNKPIFLDEAIYYPVDLFNRFFEKASDYLNEEGIIVFIFSNFAIENKLTDKHPILIELENQRFKKIKLSKYKVGEKSIKSKRHDRRKNEFAELWILGKR
jgi:methylase of polypeptide subunit release factors